MIRSRRSAGRVLGRLSHARSTPSDGGQCSVTLAGAGCRPSALRLGEAQPQPFQGEPAALADDEVVEQLDIEQLSGRHDLDGERHIGRRGGRITRRMVMDGDEGGGLLAHRVTKDFSLAS